MASGWGSVLSGGWPAVRRRPEIIAFLVFLAGAVAYLIVNVASVLDEHRQFGRALEPWRPWVWEGTSFVAWLALAPCVLWWAGRLRGARPPAWVALHLLGLVAASLAHTGAIILLRTVAYRIAGEDYRLSWALSEMALYELRKDALTYALIVGAYHVALRLTATTPAPVPSSEQMVEIRDGARTSWLRPSEIEWLSAAGNYVELHGDFGTILSRRTLREMEDELGSAGFVRIHRSRLVRRDAIARLTTRQSGDFDVVLRSGTQTSGSRRYRSNLESAE